jgi:hypothetical protein
MRSSLLLCRASCRCLPGERRGLITPLFGCVLPPFTPTAVRSHLLDAHRKCHPAHDQAYPDRLVPVSGIPTLTLSFPFWPTMPSHFACCSRCYYISHSGCESCLRSCWLLLIFILNGACLLILACNNPASCSFSLYGRSLCSYEVNFFFLTVLLSLTLTASLTLVPRPHTP